MALEDLVGPDKFISALVRTNPTSTDPKKEGDDHIRGIKNVLENSFPAIDGAVTASDADLSVLAGAATGGGTALLIPIGGIIMYGVGAEPAGFFACNGQAVSRTTYSELFAVIGTTHGAGDGSTTFNVPQLSGRAPERHGGAAGVVGTERGAETHRLTPNQTAMKRHRHSSSEFAVDSGVETENAPAQPVYEKGPGFTDYVTEYDAEEAHPVVGPRRALEFLIRAQ